MCPVSPTIVMWKPVDDKTVSQAPSVWAGTRPAFFRYRNQFARWYRLLMNSDDTLKADGSAEKPKVSETPEKKSNLRQILSVALVVFLTNYLQTGFKNWFVLSRPSAFAFALFSALTLSLFVDRPRKMWRFPLRWPVLAHLVVNAIFSLLGYAVFRALRF
jgi:hypothetical protein